MAHFRYFASELRVWFVLLAVDNSFVFGLAETVETDLRVESHLFFIITQFLRGLGSLNCEVFY